MITRCIAILLSILTIIVSLIGCADVAQNELKLKVIGVNTAITGKFSKNGGDFVDISESGSSINIYEKKIEDVDYIEVYAFRDSLNTAESELWIKIYRDGAVVKEDSVDGSSTMTTLSLEYTFGEEDTSS
jgi:hypothetical protein